MNLSGAIILLATFKTLARNAGADICLIGLIFAEILLITGGFQDADPFCSAPKFRARSQTWRA